MTKDFLLTQMDAIATTTRLGIPPLALDLLGSSQQITCQEEGFCHSGMVLAGIQPREKPGFRLEDCRNDGRRV